jgi:carbamoyl-phosphate synthase large subunit
MKEINLLFLAPHWRVSLIDAFKGALASVSTLNGKLVGADSDPFSPTLKVLNEARVIPAFEHPECLEAILDLCRAHNIQAIIPLTNKAVEFLDSHRQQFPDPDILRYLQSPETIAVCHDKLKLARTFIASGIDMPVTWAADEVEEKNDFPLIAKKRHGEGGKDIAIIEDKQDLEFYARKYPQHIFQRFIDGREFSIDWYSDQKGHPLLIVPRERLAIRAGEVTVSRIQMDHAIIQSIKKIGMRLGLRGPCNLQGILDADEKFWLTDINLRFGSGSVHTIAAGGNMPLMIYKELEIGSPQSGLSHIKDHSVMTRFYNAFFY